MSILREMDHMTVIYRSLSSGREDAGWPAKGYHYISTTLSTPGRLPPAPAADAGRRTYTFSVTTISSERTGQTSSSGANSVASSFCRRDEMTNLATRAALWSRLPCLTGEERWPASPDVWDRTATVSTAERGKKRGTETTDMSSTEMIWLPTKHRYYRQNDKIFVCVCVCQICYSIWV